MPPERLIPFLVLSIRNRRAELGFNYDALAESTGLSPEYLEFLESGEASFSMKTLTTIADALGLTPSKLIEAAEQMHDSHHKANDNHQP